MLINLQFRKNYFESNDNSDIALFKSKYSTLSNNSIFSGLNEIYLDSKGQNNTLDANGFRKSFELDLNLGNGGKINQSFDMVFNNTCRVTIPESSCARKDN